MYEYISRFPRKKTSLGESLAKSHAYNPIRDSRGDARRARKVSPRVSPKVSPRVSARLLARLSAKLLARLFALAKRLAESFGLDYMHDSWQNSVRDSFLYTGSRHRRRSQALSILSPLKGPLLFYSAVENSGPEVFRNPLAPCLSYRVILPLRGC